VQYLGSYFPLPQISVQAVRGTVCIDSKGFLGLSNHTSAFRYGYATQHYYPIIISSLESSLRASDLIVQTHFTVPFSSPQWLNHHIRPPLSSKEPRSQVPVLHRLSCLKRGSKVLNLVAGHGAVLLSHGWHLALKIFGIHGLSAKEFNSAACTVWSKYNLYSFISVWAFAIFCALFLLSTFRLANPTSLSLSEIESIKPGTMHFTQRQCIHIYRKKQKMPKAVLIVITRLPFSCKYSH
jgi:hypothetical protein